MNDYDAKVHNARLNEELGEFWIEQVDLLEIHRNASLNAEDHAVLGVNRLYRSLDEPKSIIRGAELRSVFYEYDMPEYEKVLEE